jgi:hypothetical protein
MVDRFRGSNVKSPSREIPGRAIYVLKELPVNYR